MYKEDTVFYPQDEMNTSLLPVTSGCPYNRCKFCSMYKDDKFSEVAFRDIELELKNMDLYTERLFLVGADPLVIGFNKMEKLLDTIHKYLPYCATISSYASIKSVSKYTVEELEVLHRKALRFLYIGFETGRNDILELMNKGHTREEAVEQAKKLNKANLPFNTIVMYGIAGKGESVENAIETASMVNSFVTNELITMNLLIMEGTELEEMVKEGEFTPPSRKERLREVKTLVENLDQDYKLSFNTSHPSNIIKIKGELPRDKNRLVNKIETSIRELGL